MVLFAKVILNIFNRWVKIFSSYPVSWFFWCPLYKQLHCKDGTCSSPMHVLSNLPQNELTFLPLAFERDATTRGAQISKFRAAWFQELVLCMSLLTSVSSPAPSSPQSLPHPLTFLLTLRLLRLKCPCPCQAPSPSTAPVHPPFFSGPSHPSRLHCLPHRCSSREVLFGYLPGIWLNWRGKLFLEMS